MVEKSAVILHDSCSDKNLIVINRFSKIVYFSRLRNIFHYKTEIISIGNPFQIPDIISMKVYIQITYFYSEGAGDNAILCSRFKFYSLSYG
jgi:hypothetical protein